MTTIQLHEPTIFPDFNQKTNLTPGHASNELTLNTLKYKHFRAVMQHPEADQMHYLMMALTGLSENDLGELCPKDAAAISGMVFDSMKEYMQLGKKIVKGMDEE